MGKIIAKHVVKRKRGFLYYVDAKGNVCEAKMGGESDHEKAIQYVIKDEKKKGRKAIKLDKKQKEKYGCDIKSSTWRYIEVKTHKGENPPSSIPIYSTQKNLKKLKSPYHYSIYLFYNVTKKPKLIIIPHKRIKFHKEVMMYVMQKCWKGLKSKNITF